MVRVGAECMTWARQFSSRKLSSGDAVVDDQHALVGNRVGELEQRTGIDVGEHEVRPAGDLRQHVLDEVVGVRLLDHVERELLIEELAGRVVVLDGELGTCDAVVGRGQVEKRQRRRVIAQLDARARWGSSAFPLRQDRPLPRPAAARRELPGARPQPAPGPPRVRCRRPKRQPQARWLSAGKAVSARRPIALTIVPLGRLLASVSFLPRSVERAPALKCCL